MNETMQPIIYLDLDETLISTKYFIDKPESTTDNAISYKLDGYWYVTELRPCALELIEFCRNTAICKILTASTRDYCTLISNELGLGFKAEDIICRDDYVDWILDGYSGWMSCARETPVARGCIGHVNSILVDNQTPDLPNARIKIQYLGIPENRYIEFPEWNGGPEKDNFDDKYSDVILRIIELVDAK